MFYQIHFITKKYNNAADVPHLLGGGFHLRHQWGYNPPLMACKIASQFWQLVKAALENHLQQAKSSSLSIYILNKALKSAAFVCFGVVVSRLQFGVWLDYANYIIHDLREFVNYLLSSKIYAIEATEI
ncbi:MAG: hypothetical protein LUI05_00650 [Oscillospiraceae bacterium]|nr:hypothetical protein [Oscillospiraceae bacterium]